MSQAKNITFTIEAQSQLELMLQNDFTLRNKHLRLTISGKGCDGFKYSLGFDEANEKDVIISHKFSNQEINVLFDQFSNFYLNNIMIDYQTDYLNDEEGFLVINKDQDKFKGKFWKENPDLAPNL